MLTFQRALTTASTIRNVEGEAPSALAASDASTLDAHHGAQARGRVLQIVDADVPGVGRHVLDLTRHLLAEGWRVDLAYVPTGAEEGFVGALGALAHHDPSLGEIVRLEPGRGLRTARFRTLRLLRRTVKRLDPDIVHGHGIRGGTWAQLGAGAGRARVVHTPNSLATAHPDLGPTRRSAYRNLEIGLSPFTDHLIHLSTAEADHSAGLGVLPVSSSVIPAGIERRTLPNRDQARTRLGLPPFHRSDDPLTIGTTSGLTQMSDVRVVLDGFARLGARTDRAAELVVIGDGPYRAVAETYADRLAEAVTLPGAIRFVGTADVAVSMPALDLFVAPNRAGYPFELIEALSAGVPSLAARGGVAEGLLADGAAGRILASPTSVAPADALTDALGELLDADRSAMTRAARDRAAGFTTQRMGDEVTAIYRRLLPATQPLVPSDGAATAGASRA